MSIYKFKKKNGCIVSAKLNQPMVRYFTRYSSMERERMPLDSYIEGKFIEEGSSFDLNIVPLWKKISGVDLEYVLITRRELKEIEESYMGDKENRFFKNFMYMIGRLEAVLPNMLHIGADVSPRNKRAHTFQRFVKPEHEVDIKWTHVL